jgi:hypothetical protein
VSSSSYLSHKSSKYEVDVLEKEENDVKSRFDSSSSDEDHYAVPDNVQSQLDFMAASSDLFSKD